MRATYEILSKIHSDTKELTTIAINSGIDFVVYENNQADMVSVKFEPLQREIRMTYKDYVNVKEFNKSVEKCNEQFETDIRAVPERLVDKIRAYTDIEEVKKMMRDESDEILERFRQCCQEALEANAVSREEIE